MKDNKTYTAKGAALRIVLLIWPLYIISEAWIRGQLGRLIAGLVLLALIAWWAVSYALKLRRQGQASSQEPEVQQSQDDPNTAYQTKQKKSNLVFVVVAVVLVFAVLGAYGAKNKPAPKSPAAPASVKTDRQIDPHQDVLNKANNYLNAMPFSYSGLIEQLEFEGFSEQDATYAADNCGADWNEQALLKAVQYLESSAFSRKGLVEQLEYEGFTREEALYGVDNCAADWEEQAAMKAAQYMQLQSFSRDDLIEQLEYEGFSHAEAVYGYNSTNPNR